MREPVLLGVYFQRIPGVSRIPYAASFADNDVVVDMVRNLLHAVCAEGHMGHDRTVVLRVPETFPLEPFLATPGVQTGAWPRRGTGNVSTRMSLGAIRPNRRRERFYERDKSDEHDCVQGAHFEWGPLPSVAGARGFGTSVS